MRTNLPDTHRVILATAASRPNGDALPLSPGLRRSPDENTATLAELVRDRLLEEIDGVTSEALWHHEQVAPAKGLKISALGLMAIGIAPDDSVVVSPSAEVTAPPVTVLSSGSKLRTIIELISRSEGALIQELVLATSWQRHSVRGAISGTLKNKHKLVIGTALLEGRGRVYRIEPSENERQPDIDSSGSLGAQP